MVDASHTAFLQSHALFGGLEDAVMPAVLAKLVEARFAAGEFMFRENDKPDRMYFLLTGSAEVFKDATPDIASDSEFAQIRLLGPGDAFGAMGLIDMQPRSASVRALEPVCALSLSGPDLHRLYREAPQAFTIIVLNLARDMSRNLREMHRIIAGLSRDGSPIHKSGIA